MRSKPHRPATRDVGEVTNRELNVAAFECATVGNQAVVEPPITICDLEGLGNIVILIAGGLRFGVAKLVFVQQGRRGRQRDQITALLHSALQQHEVRPLQH
ncbi:MAG: hypothetical protein R3C10_05405 [Pirellulales bacterium]